MTGEILIITGRSGSGKTAFCAEVVNTLRQGVLGRIDIRGILSPALFRHSEKVGIQSVNLLTYEHKNLAEADPDPSGTITTKHWGFDPQVIEWCNNVLAEATPSELFLLDEIGPLELERHEGFTRGLEAVDCGEYNLALVVVRPHLVDKALERWPGAQVLNVEDLEDKTRAIEGIVTKFE